MEPVPPARTVINYKMKLTVEVSRTFEIEMPNMLSNWAKGTEEWTDDMAEQLESKAEEIKDKVVEQLEISPDDILKIE